MEEQVIRNKEGFWTHSRLPYMGEYITDEAICAFERENNIKVKVITMNADADEVIFDKWLNKGDSCIDWKPTKPSISAFLLSIHDTEDGPVSWWAEPFKFDNEDY